MSVSPQLTKVRNSRVSHTHCNSNSLFQVLPKWPLPVLSPTQETGRLDFMSTIQTQDPGMTRHKELHFRVWTILINHEYSHVEAFHQNNSWFKKKKKTLGFHAEGRRFHSHPQRSDVRNLETAASAGEGKGKPSLGDHSFLWCGSQLSPPGGWGEPTRHT